MRALYTASTGMAAQELNVQVISNNIANQRTTGYKRQRAQFMCRRMRLGENRSVPARRASENKPESDSRIASRVKQLRSMRVLSLVLRRRSCAVSKDERAKIGWFETPATRAPHHED